MAKGKSSLLHNFKKCKHQPSYRFIARGHYPVGDAKNSFRVSILSFKALFYVILTLKFTFYMGECSPRLSYVHCEKKHEAKAV